VLEFAETLLNERESELCAEVGNHTGTGLRVGVAKHSQLGFQDFPEGVASD